jgi:hypothetical protein
MNNNVNKVNKNDDIDELYLHFPKKLKLSPSSSPVIGPDGPSGPVLADSSPVGPVGPLLNSKRKNENDCILHQFKKLKLDKECKNENAFWLDIY